MSDRSNKAIEQEKKWKDLVEQYRNNYKASADLTIIGSRLKRGKIDDANAAWKSFNADKKISDKIFLEYASLFETSQQPLSQNGPSEKSDKKEDKKNKKSDDKYRPGAPGAIASDAVKNQIYNASIKKLSNELVSHLEQKRKIPTNLFSKIVNDEVKKWGARQGKSPVRYAHSLSGENIFNTPDLKKLASEVEAMRNQLRKVPKADSFLTGIMQPLSKGYLYQSRKVGRGNTLEANQYFLSITEQEIIIEFLESVFGPKLNNYKRSIPFHRATTIQTPPAPSAAPQSSSPRDNYQRPLAARQPGRLVNRLNNMFPRLRSLGGRVAPSSSSSEPSNFSTKSTLKILRMFSPTTNPVIVVIIVVLLFTFILLFSQGANIGNQGSGTQTAGESLGKTLSISKSAPSSINYGDQVTFTINVSYPSSFGSITIIDPIPSNAEFVSCSDNCVTEKNSSGKVISAKWTISSSVTSSSSKSFDYAKYGFPKPQSPNPILTARKYQTYVNTWNNYMSQPAIKAGQILGMDPEMIGGWTLHEAIPNTFYDNCYNNNKSKGGDYNPNTPCKPSGGDKSPSWQISYGYRPYDWFKYHEWWIQEAVDKMYSPGANIAEIGQKVIEASKKRDPANAITVISKFPTNKTVKSLITETRNGNFTSQILLGILIKDDAIGTYLVGKDIKYYMDKGSQMGPAFGSWTSSQRASNAFDAAYQAAKSANNTASPSSQLTSNTASFQITLKPMQDNSYIANQAFIQTQATSSTSPTSNNVCPAGTDMGVKDGYENGVLKKIRICNVQGAYVNADLATNYYNLVNDFNTAYANRNIKIGTPDPVQETFRSMELQITMWNRNNCTPATYSSTYKGTHSCRGIVAWPGTSNHQMGHAIDFECYENGKWSGRDNFNFKNTTCYSWLKNNASKYGLKPYSTEPFHWSVNGG